MAAWGTEPFDNDDAADFAVAVADQDSLASIEAAFDKVLAAGAGPIEAPLASTAIAGAEILTLLADRGSDETEYPDEIEEWAAETEHTPAQPLLDKAIRVLDRIAAPPSELLELWSEDAEDLAEWKATLEDIKDRLAEPEDEDEE